MEDELRLRLYAVVVPVFLCITSCGAFADTADPSPSNAQAAKILDEAVGLHCKGQVAEAIAKYQQVARESTDITQIKHARFARAACQLSLRQYDAAQATFEAYAKDYPNDAYAPLALVHAGNCLAEQGRLADAAPYYEKALKTKQNKEDMVVWLGWAHLGMGKALVNAGRYADALTHLEQAITNASEDKVSDEAIALLSDDLSKLEQSGAAGSEGVPVCQRRSRPERRSREQGADGPDDAVLHRRRGLGKRIADV